MAGQGGVERGEDIYRLIRILAVCLAFVAVCWSGFSAPTRVVTLFFLAGVFSLAAAYELSVRAVAHYWLLLSALFIFAMAGVASYLLDRTRPLIPDAQGPLIAAHDPVPAVRCGALKADKSDLVMMFGTDRVIGRGPGPFAPIRIGTCPALTVTRAGRGLLIDAFGYDSGDDVVYRIQKNVFSMVLRGFSQEHRPDASTLIVSDGSGGETLFLRYLGANSLKVRGTFRCGDTHPVVVSDSDVRIGGRTADKGHCAIVGTGGAPGLEYSDGGLAP